MKKYIILFITLLLLATGCSNINNLSYDEISNKVLSSKVNKPNTSLRGYEFYLPKNMTMLNDLNDNNVLYSNGDKYYLYVDLVSYSNKVKNEYRIRNNDKIVYSKNIYLDNKYGYILVTNYENQFFVEVMYNYSKIEVITNDIRNSIINSLVILKSINYNDNIISILLENSIDHNEEKFRLSGPSSNTEQFLEYISEYGTYKEDEDKSLNDEDVIKINPID